MVLDKLYFTMRRAKYPIKNRAELIRILGEITITFEGNILNAEKISLLINKYPINNVADFFHRFLAKEDEYHNFDEYDLLNEFESESEWVY